MNKPIAGIWQCTEKQPDPGWDPQSVTVFRYVDGSGNVLTKNDTLMFTPDVDFSEISFFIADGGLYNVELQPQGAMQRIREAVAARG